MFTLETAGRVPYLRSRTSNVIMRTPQEALDVVMHGFEPDIRRFLFMETNFPPEFYDLKTKLAGEILQKFSNYQIKAAILGTFDFPDNPRFGEFMFESNHGKQLRFANEESDAVGWLIR